MATTRVEDDFQRDALGVWTRGERAVVRREAIFAYARAIGETAHPHLAGDAAPLLFGVVPSWDLVADTFREVVPTQAHGRLVHGEHVIRASRPLVPGDGLVSRARLVAIKPVSTGTVVVVEAESRTEAGVVVRQLSTAFVLGVVAAAAAGTVPERPAPVEGAESIVEVPTDAGLPARYAEASGDRSPIHLDADAARAIGLPGVILHGMCSLAMAARAVCETADRDPRELREIRARFADVAFPGEPLVTRVVGDGASLGFRVTDAAGRPLIVDGRTEFGPATDHLEET